MSVTPETIVAASKANAEAGLKTATSFITTLFTAVERVSSLNLATARGAFDDSVAFSKAVIAAKDPKALPPDWTHFERFVLEARQQAPAAESVY